MKSKAQTRLYDEKCLDLAKYFYPDATKEQLDRFADDIQNIVEDASDEMSREPREPDGECFRGGEAAAYEAEQMAEWQRLK